MSEFQKVRMAVSHGPDLHFEGRVIGSYSTQNNAGTKDRWTELRLWETRGGAWIAESVGCSSRRGEGEIREAAVIDREEDWLRSQEADRRMIAEVMQHFQWTTAAKAFAREMGWDVIRRVE